jgi:hypothetical protein
MPLVAVRCGTDYFRARPARSLVRIPARGESKDRQGEKR